MAKIKKGQAYKTCVARYDNTSELLPETMDVSCGGLQARVKAGKNYILPVFIVNAIMERYALQHTEVRNETLADKRMRGYKTKRVRPVVDYEILPDYIDESEVERYAKVKEFMTKLKDPKSEEYKDHIAGEGQDSLFFDLELPISQLDYSDIMPKPDSYFEEANRQSRARHPDSIERNAPQNTGEIDTLRQLNTMLTEKVSAQEEKMDKMMQLLEATIANQTNAKTPIETVVDEAEVAPDEIVPDEVFDDQPEVSEEPFPETETYNSETGETLKDESL